MKRPVVWLDISSPQHDAHIRAVERLLADLKLEGIKNIRVLNKQDRVDRETRTGLARRLNGIALSATHRPSLLPLIRRMAAELSANGMQSTAADCD